MYDHIDNPAAYEAAIRARIKANARKTFQRTYPDWVELEDWLALSKNRKNEFAQSLAYSLDTYGKLSPKQVEAVRKCIKRDADRKAEAAAKRAELAERPDLSALVGKRKDFAVTVEAVHEISREKFHYYDDGISYLYRLRDASGACIMIKSDGVWAYITEAGDAITSRKYNALPADAAAKAVRLQAGDVVTIKATIKKHDEYRGNLQTWVNRPVVTKVSEETFTDMVKNRNEWER